MLNPLTLMPLPSDVVPFRCFEVTCQEKHKKNFSIFGKVVLRNKQVFVISPTVFSLLWQVSSEILQNSPQYVLKRKAETINNGLQAIEKMLQQKSENIAKAKEVQKVILPKKLFVGVKRFLIVSKEPCLA